MLQPETTKAIWRSAIIELARVGYARLSMEMIAKRAGVGKAALYRRWSGKEDMIIAMIQEIGLEIVSVDDQGSLEKDIRRYLSDAAQLLSRPLSTRILPDLYAEMSRDTLLSAAIRSTVQQRKRESVAQIVDRAVERGELQPKINRETVFDLLAGPMYWRILVTRQPTGDDFVDELTVGTMNALKALSQQTHRAIEPYAKRSRTTR